MGTLAKTFFRGSTAADIQGMPVTPAAREYSIELSDKLLARLEEEVKDLNVELRKQKASYKFKIRTKHYKLFKHPSFILRFENTDHYMDLAQISAWEPKKFWVRLLHTDQRFGTSFEKPKLYTTSRGFKAVAMTARTEIKTILPAVILPSTSDLTTASASP